MFPPLVTGIVVLMIGISLLKVGFKYAGGGVWFTQCSTSVDGNVATCKTPTVQEANDEADWSGMTHCCDFEVEVRSPTCPPPTCLPRHRASRARQAEWSVVVEVWDDDTNIPLEDNGDDLCGISQPFTASSSAQTLHRSYFPPSPPPAAPGVEPAGASKGNSFPSDLACDNGLIHACNLVLEPGWTPVE